MEDVNPTKITALASQHSLIWDQIDLAECYLTCGMYEEASDLASSILTRIRDCECEKTVDEIADMLSSSAMVLVQSWGKCDRTSDLVNELKHYFKSVTDIPVEVVLASASIQVSSENPSKVRYFLEDFLSKWQLENEKYFTEKTSATACAIHSTLEVDQYLEVVEFYAVTLLGGVLHDVDHATLWIEKAQLPEDARQDLSRRLLSLSPLKSTGSMQEAKSLIAEDSESCPLSLKEVQYSDKSMIVFSTQDHRDTDVFKRSIWSRLQNIAKRCCNYVITSNGKMLFGCLVFLICYFLRKKHETIKRVMQRRALALKKALVDFWQLAFSYQVNPLAAVQGLPAPPASRSR